MKGEDGKHRLPMNPKPWLYNSGAPALGYPCYALLGQSEVGLRVEDIGQASEHELRFKSYSRNQIHARATARLFDFRFSSFFFSRLIFSP